ncbi:MAG: LysM peptidoglycan-binding domain-containing protein [Sedimentisphaerales bacterium]|nr:LysM peptidoglycan-binding domain-containing protein [Sedimentisphaerales bacterium]
MTSDAKIGLLLGLVFIFVIAFIINGLPNLRPQQATRAGVSTEISFPTETPGGIVDNVQRAQADLDWKQLVDQQAAVETDEPVVEQPDTAVETAVQPVPATDGQDVRYVSPLPRINQIGQGIEALVEHLTAGLQSQREQGATVNMDPPRPVATQAGGSERQPAIQVPQPRSEIRLPETVARTAEPSGPSVTPSRSVATASAPPRPAGVVTVVGEGESLSSVAKRMYGPEEGNKIANVQRIFEANRDVLPSVHEVKAGQKLVIPPLPRAAVNPANPSDVLKKELFEKVRAIGERAAAQTPVPSVESRWYTVQEGDNLWKIARNQLGAGARYEEILKLNVDLIKDPAKVGPGTAIRLPLK